ncbi:division/cell wall cluster transcriptional repressor MraZ [Erysipelotrichaceae bacterium RD49]|nr:division/cell wall cluster transcriptional repressor MraZ [Erysipelotrichaceae bacterium RD49]
MFMGEYTHNIDRKGRLIMPAKFREELGERVYITRGMDGCLTVYPLEEWTSLYKKYSSLPTTNPDARMFMRFFMAKATEVEPDGQGRILIPGSLVKEAALEKECYIIGVANRVEIWSKDRWLALQEEMLPSYEKFAENLTTLLD